MNKFLATPALSTGLLAAGLASAADAPAPLPETVATPTALAAPVAKFATTEAKDVKALKAAPATKHAKHAAKKHATVAA